MIDAIEAYARRTAQPHPDGIGVLARASLEGLALRYRECLQKLESLVGNRIDTIHIVGGGSSGHHTCIGSGKNVLRIVIGQGKPVRRGIEKPLPITGFPEYYAWR